MKHEGFAVGEGECYIGFAWSSHSRGLAAGGRGRLRLLQSAAPANTISISFDDTFLGFLFKANGLIGGQD